MARRAQRASEASAWDSINPYVSWALSTGRSRYFIPRRQEQDKELMPLLLRLEGAAVPAFQAPFFIDGRKEREHWQDSFQVVCRRPDQGIGNAAVWLGTMAPEELRKKIVAALSPPPQRPRAASSRESPPARTAVFLGRPLDTQALHGSSEPPRPAARTRLAKAGRPRTMAMPVNPSAIVMGIIDDGIAFANERFLKFAGGPVPPTTRVENWWLQDGAFNGPPFGRKLAKVDIDFLLAACTDANGVLDEELFYRKAGLIDYRQGGHKSAACRAAHGTHIMDLACGFDPKDQIDDRPIVCVQLPTRATQDEEPGDLYYYIAFGIDYIVECARAIALARGSVPLPVVINISYGLLGDPHDGTGNLELFIEDKIAECQALGIDLRVVLPSGNSYLSRIHGHVSFTAAPPETKTLHWRVQPDDRTPSFLEVWLPATVPGQSRVTLRITSPTGAAWTIREEVPPFMVPFGPSPHYGKAYYVRWYSRAFFLIMLQPTADPYDPPMGPPPLFAPAGTWHIDVRHTGGLAAQDIIHAWVRRDDQIYGFPHRGRQSFLDHAKYKRFDHAGSDEEEDEPGSLVRRESTINSMATGPSTIVIGGFLGKEVLPAKYSAAGAAPLDPPPPPPPHPRWPDAAALSEDSRVHAGVLAAGTRSNSVIGMGGTSVAAPQIARVVAERLAGGNPGDRNDIQGLVTIPLPQPGRTGKGGIFTVPVVKLKRYDLP